MKSPDPLVVDFRCCSEIQAVASCRPPHSNVINFEILRQTKMVKNVFRFILIIAMALSAGPTFKAAHANPRTYGMGLELMAPEEYEALPSHPRFRAFLPSSTAHFAERDR